MRGPVERPARLLGGLADVAGLATARLGELVDLVCDHGETAAVHAGARRLDRGVEREQVRLVRDKADRFRELLDLLRHVAQPPRSEEHTSELQSLTNIVCRLLLEKKNKKNMLYIVI